MAKKEDVRKAAIKKAEGKRPKAQREVAFVTRTLKTPKKPEVWDLMKAGGAVAKYPVDEMIGSSYGRFDEPASRLAKVSKPQLSASRIRMFPDAEEHSKRRDSAHLEAIMQGDKKAIEQAKVLQRVHRFELDEWTRQRNYDPDFFEKNKEGTVEILKERIKAYDDALAGKWKGNTPRSGYGKEKE